DAHSLDAVIKALAAGSGKAYESGDVYVRAVIDGKEINVNLSSLTKVYVDGLAILESKEFYLRLLKSSYENNYIDDFAIRKNKLIVEMEEIEQNPSYHHHLQGSFTSDNKAYYHLTTITVHDELPAFPDDHLTAVLENIFPFIESELSKMRDLV